MKISIITVCFNSAATIEATIKSVLSQDYNEIEYIVVDGGSTDGTLDILAKYQGQIDTCISEPDNGIYDAMNKGLGLATGDIIGYLNSDDVYADETVVRRIAEVIRGNDADCCYGDLDYVHKNNPDKIVRRWKSRAYCEGLFEKGWHPPHPTFFVKKEIFEKYGSFDASDKIGADYELMLRFLKKHRIASHYIPAVLVKMKMGGKSNRDICHIIKANLECYRAWKKNNFKITPFFIIKKPISKLTQYIPDVKTILVGFLKKMVSCNERISNYVERQFPGLVKEQDYNEQLIIRINECIEKANGCSVLEVGGIDRPLLNRSSKIRYDGIDIEYKDECKTIYDNFFVQSVERPIENQYDLIISQTLLEHVPDNDASVTQMYNALLADGHTFHYLPSKYHPYSICLRIAGPKWQKTLVRTLRPWAAAVSGYPAFFHKCSPKQMRRLFHDKGFKSIEIIPFFRANDYFKFFFPLYILVTFWENICHKFQWIQLCSGFIIIAHK